MKLSTRLNLFLKENTVSSSALRFAYAQAIALEETNDALKAFANVVTSHDNPPIPERQYDWSAHLDGHEEDGPVGHGTTEAEAITELKATLDLTYDP